MGEAIRHRGPDEHGEYAGDGVALDIERLKVIDLVTGSQPMRNETGDVVTVFNGEIYNYKELRAELESKGHRFFSQSDTETIVHLYEEHGEYFVRRLNGMFAIALWDARRKRLVLARDPAGVKPLFYAVDQHRLVFASEIKAILTDPHFCRQIDPEALLDYLSFYYVSAPKTIYRHIRRLPAGCILVAQAGSWKIERYWDLCFRPQQGVSPQAWAARFRLALEASVQRQLQSDVPVGLFLSGGLDSAGIAAYAAPRLGRVKSFSIGYQEASYSELAEARATAGRFGAEHYEYVLGAREFGSLLERVVRHFDEPHGDWSHVAHFVVAREAKKHVTVVLAGTGGDELFGGYPTYFAARLAGWWRRLPAWFKEGVVKPLVHALPVKFERMPVRFQAESFMQGADYPLEEAHRRFKEIFSEDQRSKILRPHAHTATGPHALYTPASVFEELLGNGDSPLRGQSPVDRLMYLDFKVFMDYCALHVMDIATSAHALECRVPYLDAEMIALAQEVPWQLKVRGFTTKYLMRCALEGVLPPEVVRMKKKGFLVPAAPWIEGELKPFILEVVAQAQKELAGVFDFEAVHRLLQEHFEKRRDHARRIACLVCFFLWHHGAQPSWK